MVNIHYGYRDDGIVMADISFKNAFEEEWFQDRFIQDMILDVDGCEVAGPYLMIHPKIGDISPYMLSGGVKTLILMYKFPDRIYRGSNCGDNCAKWILEIVKKQNFTTMLTHNKQFPEPFEVYVKNVNKTVTNMYDFTRIAYPCIRQSDADYFGYEFPGRPEH